MTVLKLDASARLEGSNSRAITQYLSERLGQPTIERDLVADPLPPISPEDLMGVHGSHDTERASLQQHLAVSDALIDELRRASTLVIGLPMYNFCVPAYLKQWIDYVARAGVTFRYTSEGPEGLMDIDRAFIVTSSGGTPIGGEFDFASRYMEHICRFIGVRDVVHIDACGSKRNPQQILERAREQIDAVLPRLDAA